jgi:hypothetical protein
MYIINYKWCKTTYITIFKRYLNRLEILYITMPNFCVFQDKLITPEDIYKFNINKNSEFICYTCDKRLHFRQSRNGDKDYTEHFYHQNNIKDTHINCENDTYQSIKKELSYFHNMFSNFVKSDCKEFVRKIDLKKHIVDGYSREHNIGIEFQNSKISVNDIISRDKTTELDWIFNVEKQFIKKIDIGNLIVCEIPHDNWENAVKVVENNVFLYTGFKSWIWLVDRESYRIQIDNRYRNVWIGEVCNFEDILNNTCLQYIITNDGLNSLSCIKNDCESSKIIYARCKKSMYLLDDIYRKYIYNHSFTNNDILAVKSVAGSGKTTTLLNLAKKHNDKKILYIAFNKSLITEIKGKIKSQSIHNIYPFTFDALLYKLFIYKKKFAPTIVDLRPQFIGKIIPFLNGKPYKIREYYCKKFSQFCNDANSKDIREFCLSKLGTKKPLMEQMWNKSKHDELITFETIRKHAYINRWFNDFIDKTFDLVMVDETQDFDMIMLKMLLNDTKIPKIFVGDPKQSIYDFRGCINAFNYLPKETLIIEFYSTFRVGNPACEIIRSKFSDCWMISKSNNKTQFCTAFDSNDKYVYLFRTWRVLLQTAEKTNNIWIYNFDKKVNDIRKLHKKLQNRIFLDDDDNNFDDDLPKFLITLTTIQLEDLINNLNKNIVGFEDSKIQFYTTHSYKGMENDNVRLANDIDLKSDENIYYVAITRGMKQIVIDD